MIVHAPLVLMFAEKGYDMDIGYTKTGHMGYTYMFISIGDVVVQFKDIRCG